MIDSTPQTPVKHFEQHVETRRWFILAAFSLFSASNNMLWITFSPITTATQEYYNISVNDVIQFSNAYMYVYFALSFLGAWLSYRWFTKSILSAMVINAVGGWIRYAAGDSYGMALAGQYIASSAQNVVLFMPVLIADRWFPVESRTWAVTIASFANTVGWGFGFIFPTILVQDGPQKLHQVLLYEAIIATVPLVMGVFSIREKPKIAPSYSAQVKQTSQSNFFKDFLVTVKNIKCVIETICFGNLIGQAYTLSSVIVLFIPDASLIQQGFVGLVFLGCGIVAGIIATALLSKMKTENYDPIFKFFMIISFIGLLVLAILIKRPDNMTSVYALIAVLGIGLQGFQPFAAQALAERTFPVQEVIPVNLMMIAAQVFGIIGNYLTTASFVGDNGMWALVGLITPCTFYITFFHRTETKRQQAENQWKQIAVSDATPTLPLPELKLKQVDSHLSKTAAETVSSLSEHTPNQSTPASRKSF